MIKFCFVPLSTISLFLAKTAAACPLCHSSTADEVRSGIEATAQDGTVILALAGPFVALGIVLSLLNRFTPDATESPAKEIGED